MNISKRLLDNYIRDIIFSNHSKGEKRTEIGDFFYARRCKKTLAVLEKNGVDLEEFIHGQFGVSKLGDHFEMLLNFIENDVINVSDLRYVVSIDNFIEGMGEVHNGAQYFAIGERPIYKHKNVNVDVLASRAVAKARILKENTSDKFNNVEEKEIDNKDLNESKNNEKDIVSIDAINNDDNIL